MQAQSSEADAGGPMAVNRIAGCTRKHDPPTRGSEPELSRNMNVDADVPRVGQCGTSGVQADPDSHPQVVWPDRHENFALNHKRGIESRRRLLEDCEQLVGTGVDLPAAELADGATEQRPDIGQQTGVAIAKVPYETGRVLDIGEQEGDEACRQGAHFARPCLRLPTDAYVLQLPGDEADRHDPKLAGGLQKPRSRPISGRFILEGGLVETRQCVADVGLVVDRQSATPARIDNKRRSCLASGHASSRRGTSSQEVPCSQNCATRMTLRTP